MGKRRMFSNEITSSDAFMSMPLSSQALYFHLGMNADDDGVVNNPRTLQRSINASEDDLRILIAKRFIIPIEESGIIVVKHWKINNYIQKDRYTPSKYQKELAMLELDENNAYKEKEIDLLSENQGYTSCIQNVYRDKISKDKNSIDNNEMNNNAQVRDDSNENNVDSNIEEITRIAKTPWLGE